MLSAITTMHSRLLHWFLNFVQLMLYLVLRALADYAEKTHLNELAECLWD
jgi:hypothetical protein